MNLDRVDVVVAGVDSVLHLPSARVERPLAERRYAVRNGVLVALDQPRLVIHGGAGVEPGDHPDERAGRACSVETAARRTRQAAGRRLASRCGDRRDHRARGCAAVPTPGAARCSPRRPQQARHLADGWRDRQGQRGGRAAPGEEPDPAGAPSWTSRSVMMVGDGAEIRQGAGHRVGRPVLLPHREALEGAQDAEEGRTQAQAKQHAAGAAGQGLFRDRQGRWRWMHEAISPAARRPAA